VFLLSVFPGGPIIYTFPVPLRMSINREKLQQHFREESPGNILCLTYTDAGAIAMRRRLLSFIGPDAYKVNIHSFHSFCNDIIQENLPLFEKTSLDPISDLEKIQLLKNLIDNFPKNHPLKRYRGDVYFEMGNLQSLFSAMKREGWTPAFIHEKIDQYLADVRTDKIAEETEKMTALRAAVDQFTPFQELMRRRNRYDFDDMINWVILAFEENKALRSSYQERYQYILVDEYQDTHGTQNRLLDLLISYWDQPNVFVVGDNDQRSYRFQGANLENMPRLLEYRQPREEMTDITLQVEKLVQEGVAPGKIAVIYKENRYGEELARFFQLKKIPVYSNRSVNLFEVPFAQKIILLLRYLAAEHDAPYGGDEMLFEILHFDFFGIAPIEIAKLSVEVAQRRFGDQRTSLRRLLYEKANRPAKDLFDSGLPEGMKKASRSLEKLIGDVPNVTLQTLFEHTIRESGLLSAVMQSQDKIMQIQLLTALFDFVKEESRRDPDMGLEQLVQMTDLMKDNAIPLPLVQVAGSDKAVHLLTAQGSNGLEFQYVFFAGCNASVWEKKRKPGGGYKYPDTLFSSRSGKEGEAAKAIGEEALRHLFYVALARAEQHLSISWSRYRPDGKELEPSVFIAEILDRHALPVEKAAVPAAIQADFDALSFSETIAPEIAAAEEAFISRTLEKFVMNVTALNNYLKCPLEFYYRNLVRIPSPKNEATEFGSAVHFALQRLFEKMKAQVAEQFPFQEEMLQDFQWYMHRHREIFTREAFSRRMEYGLEVLTNYYDKYLHEWNKIVAVERNIRNVTVKGVPLKGKLDKLEFQGKDVNVVDYKTGDVDKAKDKLTPPNAKDPNGGDYWRQAVFYKILVDGYADKDWKVVSTEFDFVEPDKKKEYRKVKIVITPADITTVIQQIETTWKKIQNREFYTGCGEPDCHWCNFVKTNNLAIALHKLNDEDQEEET